MDSMREFLKVCTKTPKPCPNTDVYDDVVFRSNMFPILFPIQSVRCITLVSSHSKEELRSNITSAYPLMHEDVLKLSCAFISHKRSCGTAKEKLLYNSLNVVSFVDRLLKNRAVAFYGANDKYILNSKQYGSGGWEKIGTDAEVPPLLLNDCLSYDEMRISAMLYVSSPTVFINDGSRFNAGNVMLNVQESGIIIGLIGTRFEVEGKMEYQDIVIDRKQNTERNGYGEGEGLAEGQTPPSESLRCLRNGRDIWKNFYQLPRLTYYEAEAMHRESDKPSMKDHEKHFVIDGKEIFDNYTYARHLTVSFDCALLEASTRGLAVNKTAYLHVVGLGLGVWKIFAHQNQVFVKTFLERIRFLAPRLQGLSDVHFAYFRDIEPEILTKNGMFIECSEHPLGGLQVHLSKREPSSKLNGTHSGKLLVETYAWDGNAQPGNEFWDGSLTGSGDPAAACSSQVAELHNSHINTAYVCGDNLHVAGQYGVHHISDYAQFMLQNTA